MKVSSFFSIALQSRCLVEMLNRSNRKDEHKQVTAVLRVLLVGRGLGARPGVAISSCFGRVTAAFYGSRGFEGSGGTGAGEYMFLRGTGGGEDETA
jgi:hypothetical protein